MPTTFLMLPPQSELTREWARRLAEAAPELDIIAPETMEGAEQAIAGADGAYGRIPPALLARADKLRWLQAPQAAPAAGFYYPELIAHPVVITNMREIYNDHIAAHIMAFVLAFARGLQVYLPQQQRREWRPVPRETGDVVHLPEATALIVGVGGIGGEAAALPLPPPVTQTIFPSSCGTCPSPFRWRNLSPRRPGDERFCGVAMCGGTRSPRLLRRCAPCNDSLVGCHCERSEAISSRRGLPRRCSGAQPCRRHS